ncbi:hypothetical protein QL285_002451 [Trifolium repens]|nr:hypothetical protein QL285_002451 [Trifolium repens]
MLAECQFLPFNLSLQTQSSDRWQRDRDKGYIVRGAYQLLTYHVSASMDVAENLIWYPQVSLKVSFFAWHLLHDRFTHKGKSSHSRHLISHSSHLRISM